MQPVAETFVLWFVVTLTAFYLGLAGNETDTMAYARHAADPTWLPNDWFLTRQIPYRGLFNALLGHLLEIVGTTPGIVVGRLLSFALFAFACQRLIAAAHVPLALGVAIVYWNINRITGIAAGEWMVRGLETKAFAWPFVLLAVAALLRQRWRSYWLSLGAALSFHVLVGAYAFLGLAAATLAVHRRAALGALRDSWAFFVTGVPGLVVVVVHVLQQSGSETSENAWWLYVAFRNPHHVIPNWPLFAWMVLIGLGLVNVFLFRMSPHAPARTLAAVALAWEACTVIGLALFLTGQTELLRFYWFRMADVGLPLLTPLAVCGHVCNQPRTRRLTRPLPAAVGLAVVLTVVVALERALPLALLAPEPMAAMWMRNSVVDPAMAHWVRTHTDSNEVLLVPPNLKNPYFSFERPVVATFEHIPPSPTDVVEWYARMEALNGGSPIEGHGFDARSNLARRYRTLDSSQLATIGSQYGASLYLTDNRSRTDLVLVHRTHRLALYRIPGAK